MKSIRSLSLLVIMLEMVFLLTTPIEGSAKWWDKFGEPKYGGELIFRTDRIGSPAVDPTNPRGGAYMLWYETLFMDSDWKVDRNIQPFKGEFIPVEYCTGLLAESWDWIDPKTVKVKLREGVYFQDKEPVNGREFTAEDVQFCFDRMMGTGSGFTKPNPFFAGSLADLEKVLATGKYTVEFKLKKAGALGLYLILTSSHYGMIYPHEVVENDLMQDQYWQSTNGTGPFVLTDAITDTSATYRRNPKYWGTDERHPENRIPYTDSIKYLAIPDVTTAIAALRSGKIDVFPSGLTWQQAATLSKNKPEIQQAWQPSPGQCLELRCDREPFTDIRVRKALQMAIDLPSIAKALYGGTVDGTPCGLLSPNNIGWVLSYKEWPKKLQSEYTYDVQGAKTLLMQAGYPDGFNTECLTFPSGEFALLETIKAQLMDIGVNMNIKAMEFQVWISSLYSGKYDQMTLMNTIGAIGSPMNAFLRRASNSKANFTHCKDTHYDSLINQVQTAATLEEAKAFSIKADQYALQQHWSVNIFPYYTAVAWRSYVKGYSGEYFSRTAYYAARMWIDQKSK